MVVIWGRWRTMSFLNPLYLIAALGALVPLIIHLLFRQRARIQVFPSLEFLRKMMRKRTRRFQLKQILLLIARMLLLGFIAVALAKPTITGGKVVKGHLPTSAVIVLDDSFSMQRSESGRRLFDVAVEKVRALLDYFERGDEIHLFTASVPMRNLTEPGAKDPERLRGLVEEIACSNRVTDMATPLKQALAILGRSDNPSKEIYIISDMQKTAWDELAETVETEATDVKVMVVDIAAEEVNACVKEIGFRIPAGSDDLEMEVNFERFKYEDAQGRVAEVFVRDVLLDRAVFSPGEFTREKEVFRLPAFEGFLWGEAAMAEDRLPIDDRRYFALPSRRRTVGIIGGSYYVSKALSPKGGSGFRPVEIEEGALNRENLGRLDILVADNVTRFSPLEIEALSDFLTGGGSLLLFLGSRVDIGAYNRNLLPHRGSLRIDGVSEGGEAGFYTIDRIERGHRIFSKFKPDASPFSDARFYQFMKVSPNGDRVIATFSDGSPAMIEPRDRVIVVTSSADIAWSDFVLTSQFLPILHETLLHLSSRAGLSQSYIVGEEIVIRGATAEGEVILQGPGGAARHFPEALGQATVYRIESPEEPGIYFLKTDQETLSVFAVNVDTGESDLAKVAFDQVKSRLAGFDVRRISAVDDIGESVSLLRQGRDLARSFVGAGLIVIVFESLLASNLLQRFRRDQEEDAFTHS